MDREDALLCLERHATSKIRQGIDLMTVRTMGFRGEALPSIASVSHFRLVTREHTADMGVEVRVSGGKTEDVREIGAPPGTQIEVRDLFFTSRPGENSSGRGNRVGPYRPWDRGHRAGQSQGGLRVPPGWQDRPLAATGKGTRRAHPRSVWAGFPRPAG